MYLSRVTNRNKVGRLGLLAVAMTATLGVSAFAQDPGPIEESSIAVIESVLSSAGVLVDNFGCNTQAIINYSGRITLGEGWSAQMQGLWGDTSLTLNYFSNSPDGYHFNVGGGGNFGSLPWTIDTAQAAFANVPPQTRQIGLGDAKVLFIGNNPDWHWWKRFVRLPDGSVIDWGAFTITRDGIPQMTYVQRSYSAPRNPGEPGPHAIYATADWQTACEFRLDGTTTESPSGADISGTLTIGVEGRQPPCPGGTFVRVVGTTTECPNHQLVWVNTLEWSCPPDGHTETSVERVVSDTPC